MSACANILVRTNQLEVELNFNKFNEKYDIFKLETTKSHFKSYAKILDKPVLDQKVRAIYFVSGKNIYVLMSKNERNKYNLKEAVKNTEDANNITITKVGSTVCENIVIQLLLNAIGSYEGCLEFLSFNNLTGHLYCIDPGLLKRMSSSSNKLKYIPSLEVAVTEDKCLTISVRTFVRFNLIKKYLLKQQYLPKYVLQSNNTLKRCLSDDVKDQKDRFVLRRFDGKKSNIKFLDVYNFNNFNKTKMGIIRKVLDIFNDKYSEICKISFKQIAVNTSITCRKKKGKLISENVTNIQSMLNEIGVNIVDSIGNNESSRCCNAIQDIIQEKYNVCTNIGKEILKNRLNICLIHNKDYYKENNDSHQNYTGVTVQHITIEDFNYERNSKKNCYVHSSVSSITQVIHEMLIKHDIERMQISLYDWSSLGVSDNVTFGLYVDDPDNKNLKKYFFMKVFPDGSFEFIKKDETTHGFCEYDDEYTDCVNILGDSNNVAGIVRFGNGGINLIGLHANA